MTHHHAFLTFVAEVGEESMLTAVSVDVKRPAHSHLIMNFFNHSPNLFTLQGLNKARSIPTAVEIIAHEIGPRVAVNNSINVNHGDDEEPELVPV